MRARRARWAAVSLSRGTTPAAVVVTGFPPLVCRAETSTGSTPYRGGETCQKQERVLVFHTPDGKAPADVDRCDRGPRGTGGVGARLGRAGRSAGERPSGLRERPAAAGLVASARRAGP